jgi:site-specific DNA-methyltransferase (adenine-specific)
MSTQECDVVMDPLGGSGTTYDVCERTGRHWIGIELESCDVIIERFENPGLYAHKTDDFVDE